MNNAFFGKTMDNVRDRTNLKIIPHTEIIQILKRQRRNITTFNDFSVYKYDKENTVFDKPIYLGFSVL